MGTIHAWLRGRNYITKNGQQFSQPLIQRPHTEFSQLSFTTLVEAHVLRVIRQDHNNRLDKVRTALDYAGGEIEAIADDYNYTQSQVYAVNAPLMRQKLVVGDRVRLKFSAVLLWLRLILRAMSRVATRISTSSSM